MSGGGVPLKLIMSVPPRAGTHGWRSTTLLYQCTWVNTLSLRMRTAHLIDLIDLVYDLWVNQKGF